MKSIFQAFLITCCLLQFSYSSVKAITETGREVLLNDDGTWAYLSDENEGMYSFTMNKSIFKKSTSSTFLLKSKKVKIGIWLNPGSWSFKNSTDNEAAEYQFTLKGEDAYGIMISEAIEIPLDNLVNIAYENALKVSSDIKIMNREYRNVNGINIAFQEMKGTIQGMKITYYGYYYTDSSGSVQLLMYSGDNTVEKYKNQMFDLLNGMAAY